jgi:hypothetical protein
LCYKHHSEDTQSELAKKQTNRSKNIDNSVGKAIGDTIEVRLQFNDTRMMHFGLLFAVPTRGAREQGRTLGLSCLQNGAAYPKMCFGHILAWLHTWEKC